MQSPISNYCLKVKIVGYTEPQLVPKLLLHVSVRKLHNNIVSTTKYGGLKLARDQDDNIIISDSTLRSLLPPHLKKFHQDTRSCVVTNVAYLPKVCIRHYFHGVIIIFKTQGSQPKCSKQKVWGKRKSYI